MLQELMENQIDYAQLNEDLETFGNILKEEMDRLSLAMDNDEGSEDSWGGVTADFDTAMKQFQAAQRGLGIVNKLQPGEYRAKHASRVMSNLNRLRASIQRIGRQMDELISNEY